MDGIDQHLQSVGICRRLYNCIMRRLTSHAFKNVTLGPPRIQGLPSIPEDGTVPSEAGRSSKPPRKTVSINDEVEDMEKTMKLRRKNKSFEKLKSLESTCYEQCPQRSSILKKGSDFSMKRAAAFVNRNYDRWKCNS